MTPSKAKEDGWWRILARSLWVCRVPLTSALISVFMFWNLPQARDLFIEITGSHVTGISFWTAFYVLVAGVWLLPVYCAGRLALESEAGRIGTGLDSSKSWLNFAVPALLVLICLASLIVGTSLTYVYMVDSTDANVVDLAKSHLATILIVTLLIAFAFSILASMFAKRDYAVTMHRVAIARSTDTPTGPPRSLLRRVLGRPAKWLTGGDEVEFGTLVYFAILLVLTILMPLLWIIEPTTLAEIFPRAILLPFLLGFWIAPLTLLGLASHRVRLPLIFIFLLASMIVDSAVDNHTVRTLAASQGKEQQAKRIKFEDAVRHWRAANGCKDGTSDRSCRRPIIVAAAGGASRAAFFTASVLGFLEDISTADSERFNRFSDQLFAISSVSGSSLGAVTFLALRDHVGTSQPSQILKAVMPAAKTDGLWYGNHVDIPQARSGPTPWKDLLQIILAGDFLTPVAATWIFRDSVPISPLLQWDDRANALEKAWERRFETIFSLPSAANPMSRPFVSFAPTNDNWRPVLYLNGSMVENGKRIVASTVAPPIAAYPCRLDCFPKDRTEFYIDAYHFHDLINGQTTPYEERDVAQERSIKSDVRLSTAALLSARFPAISPYGTIRNAKHKTVGHIVDGGYFENNGALTTADIINGLRLVSVSEDETAGRRTPCRRAAPVCLRPELASSCDPGDVTCRRRPEKIWPLIIQISNDPGTQACGDGMVDPDARIALPVVDWRFFPSVMHVVHAVLGARVARGTHASELLSFALNDDRTGYFAAKDELKPGFVHFRVCPQPREDGNAQSDGGEQQAKVIKEGLKFRDVSMSWWLSKPVQSYLDDQLCNPHNQIAFARVLMALSIKAAEAADDQEHKLASLHARFTDEITARCSTLKALNKSSSEDMAQPVLTKGTK